MTVLSALAVVSHGLLLFTFASVTFKALRRRDAASTPHWARHITSMGKKTKPRINHGGAFGGAKRMARAIVPSGRAPATRRAPSAARSRARRV